MYLHEMSPGVQERYDFYQASIYPTVHFGGTNIFEGWDCNIANLQEAYDGIVTLESPFTINLEFNRIRNEHFEITAKITLTENIINNNNKVFFVITNWVDFSEENPWYFLVVAKSEEEDVTIINLEETAIYTSELNVEMQPDWNLNDLYAIAIIQSWDNYEILQSAQVRLFPANVNNPTVPAEISLHQNYPNPFNPSTNISFELNTRSSKDIELLIYNTKGQKVKQFIRNQLSTGQHSIIWDGNDENEKQVASGIYLYVLKSGTHTFSKKMIFLK